MENFDDPRNSTSLENSSPEFIAKTLFGKNPSDKEAYQILAYQDGSDLTYIFEILITVVMEGLNMFTPNGIKNSDLNLLETDHITFLNPWLNRLGFSVN